MSHVSFATEQDSTRFYLPLRASGFNGFPFPIIDVGVSEIGVGTGYPIGLTLKDAVYAYWKVKVWQITIDLTTTPPYTHNLTYYSEAPRRGFGDGPSTDELDLVFGPGWIDGNDDATSNFWLFDPEEVGGWISQAVRCEGLIYPFSIIDVESGGGPSVSNPGNTHPAGTLYFNGMPDVPSIALQMYADSAGWGGTVIVEPFDFWSYT